MKVSLKETFWSGVSYPTWWNSHITFPLREWMRGVKGKLRPFLNKKER